MVGLGFWILRFWFADLGFERLGFGMSHAMVFRSLEVPGILQPVNAEPQTPNPGVAGKSYTLEFQSKDPEP